MTVAGNDALAHPERVRRVIGVVSQKSGADPVATGRQNPLLQGRLYGLNGADAGLDPQARTAMWAEISRLAADESMAILLTTHHLEEADRLARRVSIVDRDASSSPAARTG